MARSLNRAQLIGNLGNDPDFRTTPNGASVCNLSLATASRKMVRQNEWEDETDWHRIVCWNKLADIAQQYLKKGSLVFVEGKIKTRSYEKDGIKRYMTEIWADSLIMLDKKGSSEGYQEKPLNNQYSNDEDFDVNLPNGDEDDIPF